MVSDTADTSKSAGPCCRMMDEPCQWPSTLSDSRKRSEAGLTSTAVVRRAFRASRIAPLVRVSA
ncbi:MAG TPA: hypothetical protein DDW31_02840, partial [candidate division Zixibacteria bacterium]|nr:hypothetical protein [candidate division Zixibacteria bacterium]